jgi:hypothetical protein
VDLKDILATLKSFDQEVDAGIFILRKMGIWQTLNPISAKD